MDRDGLVALLADRTSRDDVLSGLLSLDVKERKALGPMTRGWLTQGTRVKVSEPRQALAVLATAEGHRQAALVATHVYFWDPDLVADATALLTTRAPAWLPRFVDALLDDDDTIAWRLVRSLVRAGAVARPERPEYFSGTVRALPDYGPDRRPLVEDLAEDPGLLGDHLLRMLSTERVGRLLAQHDGHQESSDERLTGHGSFPAGTWRVALLTVTRQGRLDRGRLLDTVLAAPLRDWAAVDLSWYVGMHDALEPTVEEVVARQSTYARLLTVDHGPSVAMAQRAILRVLRDPRFQPGPVVDASRATLGRSDKTTVTAQLRLLKELGSIHPGIDIADAVRIAEDHPRPDVRRQAAKLLGRLGAAEPPARHSTSFSVPAPEPWPEPRRVEPVTSADELAEVLLGLIEDVDAIEMERAIDGLLRFADERPGLSEQLWKRIHEVERYEGDPRTAPVVLAHAWLAPRRLFRRGDWSIVLGSAGFSRRPPAPASLVGALGRRLTGIAMAIRGGPHAGLALPTGADGSLDADVLAERLGTMSRRERTLDLEVALALLRVRPSDRAQVPLGSWLRRSRLVTRVLGAGPPDWERGVVLARNGWGRITVFLDGSGAEGDDLDGILARCRPERTVEAEVQYGEYEPRFEQTLALGAALLPHDADVLAAHSHPYLHRDLRTSRAVTVPVLDALARSRAANGPPASSALILALGAEDARARIGAQDALLDLATHGVLDGGELGRQAALLLAEETVVGKRISTGLADVTRACDAAALPVLDALQGLVHVLPGRRDAGSFLDLAADLGERTGRRIRLPVQFRELAAGRSTSMAAQASRRLL